MISRYLKAVNKELTQKILDLNEKFEAEKDEIICSWQQKYVRISLPL